MNPQRSFLLTNLAAMILLITAYAVYVTQVSHEYMVVVPGIVLSFAILNVFFMRMLRAANEKSPRRFVAAFTGVVGIKLMASLIFTLIYILLVDKETLTVVAALFISYLVFTIILIRSSIKKSSETSGTPS